MLPAAPWQKLAEITDDCGNLACSTVLSHPIATINPGHESATAITGMQGPAALLMPTQWPPSSFWFVRGVSDPIQTRSEICCASPSRIEIHANPSNSCRVHHHVQRDRAGKPLKDQCSHASRLASTQYGSAFRQAARLGRSVSPASRDRIRVTVCEAGQLSSSDSFHRNSRGTSVADRSKP